ncbi:MAG: hypothetical protein ABFD50_06500, partial [Smithella sp.]
INELLDEMAGKNPASTKSTKPTGGKATLAPPSYLMKGKKTRAAEMPPFLFLSDRRRIAFGGVFFQNK